MRIGFSLNFGMWFLIEYVTKNHIEYVTKNHVLITVYSKNPDMHHIPIPQDSRHPNWANNVDIWVGIWVFLLLGETHFEIGLDKESGYVLGVNNKNFTCVRSGRCY